MKQVIKIDVDVDGERYCGEKCMYKNEKECYLFHGKLKENEYGKTLRLEFCLLAIIYKKVHDKAYK